MIKSIYIKSNLCILFILIAIISLGNKDYNKKMMQEISLIGDWKFSIIHYNEWQSPSFNASAWEQIKVPGNWESQGYNGYNGYGFYRKNVRISDDLKENELFLVLGYIDDVDEVFFNGQRIGATGTFPPNFKGAFEAFRTYLIPDKLINFDGDNIIAVKVFDMHGSGGITKGNPGIYIREYPLKTDVSLVGTWKFTTDNHDEFKEPDFNDSNWVELVVPGFWENQGFKGYNGYAWYRKQFQANQALNEDYLVFLGGKIDDCDQVYLNGVLIGQTGTNDILRKGYGDLSGRYFNSERAYVFPAHLLKKGSNTIAIKVVDPRGDGGIYEGPVGIIGQSKFREYWKKRSKKIKEQKKNEW